MYLHSDIQKVWFHFFCINAFCLRFGSDLYSIMCWLTTLKRPYKFYLLLQTVNSAIKIVQYLNKHTTLHHNRHCCRFQFWCVVNVVAFKQIYHLCNVLHIFQVCPMLKCLIINFGRFNNVLPMLWKLSDTSLNSFGKIVITQRLGSCETLLFLHTELQINFFIRLVNNFNIICFALFKKILKRIRTAYNAVYLILNLWFPWYSFPLLLPFIVRTSITDLSILDYR